MSARPPKKAPNSAGEARDSKPLGHALGAGSEAAEGIHGVGITPDPGADTALEARRTGAGIRDGAHRVGSEPLLDRAVEHRSGYGGEGGAPRTSADEREHVDGEGRLEAED